ncbi:zinc-finger domain of monoamine-oxidase A repressor R1-domain-containing protein [Boletus edulis BED1]|uniref:Zinc-finger domain of monoamine-oxidase A repressor R1-domain-containing protein n=1 Tax=Boletus edulis BED1 TaxID=1328754 RepID=A0AAD4BZP4_BOLED|nr:zinc-finger domain of monoamine-oxidase A repressor R1-domain-containing protein [Boletus edulis BED1]
MGGTAPRKTLSRVFVELPSSRTPLKHLPHVSSAGHKENALSRASASQMSSSTPLEHTHNKRKLDADAPVADMPPSKKPKQLNDAISLPVANAADEYPNGFVYCHQCNKKRDATISVRCTTKDRKGRRCNAKYCKPCLKNRYGLVLENILADGETGRANHVHGVGYHFRCPRCDDVCNCVACRKAKGLQPTGNLTNAARQSGLTSAADVLRQDPKAAGPMANKPGDKKTKQQAMHGAVSKRNGKSFSAPVKGGARQATQPKAKPAPKAKVKAPSKPKLLAKPVWTSVGTALSRTEAEERVNIREFALRFSPVLDLSRSHLDELDEIKLSRTRNLEDDDEDLIPWVSEACVKSLLLGLLNMIDAKGNREKHLKTTVTSIRESGAHLNKIWAALATLRDRQENASTSSRPNSTGFPLSFPDPLPPPESVSIIRTRSGANQSNTGSINVLRTAQLVPVISALVNAAVDSEAVRQELDAGVQESKERVKEARESHRIENERFEREKEREKGKRLDKSRTEYHKRIVTAIDDALKVASYASIPRISSLGRDIEGRIYWALTPGMNEREDALDLLRSYSQGRAHKSRSRRKPLVPSEEDRSALRKWSWFVAVWGKRPPTVERTLVEDEDEDDDEEEQWWGFCEPEEIMKLASWVHFKADLEGTSEQTSRQCVSASSGSHTQYPDSDVDMEDLTNDESSDDELEDDDMEASITPTKGEIATLVKELGQYASLLGGRIRRDEEIEDTRPVRR